MAHRVLAVVGVEPELALVKYKRLVGGGMMKIVNMSVDPALAKLGYDEAAIARLAEDRVLHRREPQTG